uniref:EF-hand domain-containing protein n=1 Tax=Ciona savignyi TaxID=51511 RepID=H2YG51_CIOSA
MRDSGSDDIPIDAQIQSEDDTEGAQRGSSVPSSLGESIDHITRPARVFQFDEKFTNEKSKSSNISAKISNKPKQGAKFDLQVNNKKGVWRTVLNKSQLDAFRRLFCRFDQTKSGGISPAELFQATLELLPDTGNDL